MNKISNSTILIDGIEVKFPYDPYSCQRSYMRSVISAVRDGKNALLESPTGTGKTLSLLCSTISCLLSDKINKGELDLAVQNVQSGSHGSDLIKKLNEVKSGLVLDVNKTKLSSQNKLNIIYTSRTHSQLKQVIREVEKSDYKKNFNPKGLKSVLLASRDLLCVNPLRGNLSGEQLNNFCRGLLHNRGCKYYNSLRGPKSADELQFNGLIDIEDMVQMGKKSSFCPYFAVKDSQDNADLVFVPYNYLLSSTVREAMDLKIRNSIIIIDEAHNVETIAEEASSFFIKQTDIAKYIDCLKRFAIFHKDYITNGKNNSIDELKVDFSILSKLGTCLKNTDEFLTNVSLMSSRQAYNQKDSDKIGQRWCLKEIERQHVVYSAKNMLSHMYSSLGYKTLVGFKVEETINQVIIILTKGIMDDEDLDGIFVRYYDEKTLKEDSLIFLMLKKFVSFLFSQELLDFPEYYNVIITNDEKYEKPVVKSSEYKTFGWNKKFKSGTSDYKNFEYHPYNSDIIPKVLSFKCLQPVPTFIRIKREGVRSIILTSGTLGPLDVLEKHLGGGHIKFDIKLQNDHVIDLNRVWAGIVSGNSENPNLFSSSFNTRSNIDYISALGEALYKFLRCVPSGVLVFFSSYAVMNNTISTWKRIGLYSKMEMIKSLFTETRSSDSSNENETTESTVSIFSKYKENIDNGRGSVFFGICRGKMAEGIDFSDNYCRGIFLCGIPYPNRFEDTVAMKIDYLDKLSSQSSGKGNLSSEWYTTQAIRAINQAIGRSIRHIDDYGAIMLADYRFKNGPMRSSISKWVLKRLNVYNKVEDCTQSLNSFFSQFDKKKPIEAARLIKKVNYDPPIPIKVENTVQFKPRYPHNNKLKAIPLINTFSDFKNGGPDRNYSILSYIGKPKAGPESKPDLARIKDERFSFKSLNKWNFDGEKLTESDS